MHGLRAPRGIMTALITPNCKEEKAMRDTISQLVDFQVKSGIRGFYTLGTYGEGLLLSINQRKRILSLIVERVPSNLLIINNVSAISLSDALELTRHSLDLGVYNVASLPPMYYKAGISEIRSFYMALGKHDCNLLVYNNPAKTHVDITPSMILQLKNDIPNLAGLKDSSGSVERLIDIVTKLSNKLFVGIASDSLILNAMLYGADAHICGVCNAIPELAVELVKSVENGDLRKALLMQSLISRFRDLAKELQVEGFVLTKTTLNIRGIDVGEPYPPIRGLSEKELEIVKNALKNIYREAGLTHLLGDVLA
ncbi:MAG: dihydrodipicolinate synthase family protein [Desulfurococcaceae archaeon]